MITLTMGFEWDSEKNKQNFQKHGILFEEAREIFRGPVLTAVDDRIDYGETRYISIGELYSVIVIVLVHTDRKGRKRIISARRANKMERRKYYEHIKIIEKTDR